MEQLKNERQEKRARSPLCQGYICWEMEARLVPEFHQCGWLMNWKGAEGRKGISGSLKEILTLVQVFVQVSIFKPQGDTREKYFKWTEEFCGHGYLWRLFSVQMCLG